MKTYPIPEHNALSIKKMDPLVISILEGQRRSINKNVDRAFMSIQNRLCVTMGPLVHLWLTLDKIINSFEMNPNLDDSAHVQLDNIDIRQLIDLVEKTICCLGQTNVTINYQRRTSALVKVTRDPSKAKSMLRDKHGILAKREDLMFGNNFKSDLKELSELKKEASKMAEALGAKPNDQKMSIKIDRTLSTIKRNLPVLRMPGNLFTRRPFNTSLLSRDRGQERAEAKNIGVPQDTQLDSGISM